MNGANKRFSYGNRYLFIANPQQQDRNKYVYLVNYFFVQLSITTIKRGRIFVIRGFFFNHARCRSRPNRLLNANRDGQRPLTRVN